MKSVTFTTLPKIDYRSIRTVLRNVGDKLARSTNASSILDRDSKVNAWRYVNQLWVYSSSSLQEYFFFTDVNQRAWYIIKNVAVLSLAHSLDFIY